MTPNDDHDDSQNLAKTSPLRQRRGGAAVVVAVVVVVVVVLVLVVVVVDVVVGTGAACYLVNLFVSVFVVNSRKETVSSNSRKASKARRNVGFSTTKFPSQKAAS